MKKNKNITRNKDVCLVIIPKGVCFQISLLSVNVDFGRFAGRVLHDEEHFSDEFNDVASLQNQVAFPLVAKRRR